MIKKLILEGGKVVYTASINIGDHKITAADPIRKLAIKRLYENSKMYLLSLKGDKYETDEIIA